MSTINVKINGQECVGVVKETSQSGSTRFIFVDLDVKCVLSDSEPPPPAKLEFRGIWKDAQIVRIPTAPDFRRIHLSFET